MRIFGKAKPKQPAPSLEEAAQKVEARGSAMDEKINKLNAELLRYKEQMKKMRPGPAKQQLEQRALRVLKQKKIYEQQRDSLSNQAFNMEQANFATQNLKDSVSTVQAMKAAHDELKLTYKQVNINQIENLQDDMSDMLQDADEIQEILGRSYGLPLDVDEDSLLDELNSLEGELELEGLEEGSVPAYLQPAPAVPVGFPAAPQSEKAEPATNQPAKIRT